MKIIGICGGTGSGKTTFVEALIQNGYPVFECDKEYHHLTDHPTKCTEELSLAFGEEVLNEDGSLNRKRLSSIVFKEHNELLLKMLNLITWKYVTKQFETFMIEHLSAPILFLEAPLLFESKMNQFCDEIIGIIADDNVRLQRILDRDHVEVGVAQKRIDSQVSNTFLCSHATCIIENNTTLEEFQIKITEYIKELRGELL